MMVVDGVEVLDIREAAQYVQRTPETVRRWVWSGRLPARRSGNRLLVARKDLEVLGAPARQEQLSLSTWAALLPPATGTGPGTVADLVLADRAARAGR